MQPVPDFIGRVSPPPALIAGYQHSPGGDPDDPGQPEQLPNGAHQHRLFASASVDAGYVHKVRWWKHIRCTWTAR